MFIIHIYNPSEFILNVSLCNGLQINFKLHFKIQIPLSPIYPPSDLFHQEKSHRTGGLQFVHKSREQSAVMTE